MNDVSVASLEDLPALMSLEDAFPASQRWSENSWREELTADNRHVLVCGGGGAVEAAATFAVADDVVDLHRIVTADTARRRGLARHLMVAGIRWAQGQGASRMLLEVEHTNGAALALYATQGFLPIAERRDYYGPGAHAVILQRSMSEGEQS
ncbi:MAG: GNAT family N-acetyltransferase [Arachnia sp.]